MWIKLLEVRLSINHSQSNVAFGVVFSFLYFTSFVIVLLHLLLFDVIICSLAYMLFRTSVVKER